MNIEDKYKVCDDCKQMFPIKETIEMTKDDGVVVYVCFSCLEDIAERLSEAQKT